MVISVLWGLFHWNGSGMDLKKASWSKTFVKPDPERRFLLESGLVRDYIQVKNHPRKDPLQYAQYEF
jgi:hypothetical protein